MEIANMLLSKFEVGQNFAKIHHDFGPMQVIATGVAVMVVDKFGRRILLILSAFFMCIAQVPI
jgi:hypothetical protein